MEFNLNKFNPLQKEFMYFLLVVKHKSILKAAEEAGLQQSSLSKMIKNLETDLGYQLFVRSVKGVELTEFGRNVFQMVEDTYSHVQKLKTTINNQESDFSGQFSLGSHSTIARNNIHKFIPSLAEKWPSLNVQIVFDSSMNITKRILEYDIDAGLVINPIKNADLISKNVSKESMGAWKSKENQARIIVYNPDMIRLSQCLKKFEDCKKIEIKDYDIIANLISETDYIGILPSPIAERYRLKKIDQDLYNVQLSLVWHKSRIKGSFKQKVIQKIFELLTETN